LIYPPSGFFEKGSVTIDILFETDAGKRGQFQKIASFYDHQKTERFAIGQKEKDLNIHIYRSSVIDGKRFEEFGVQNIFESERLKSITISTGMHGTAIYSGGLLLERYPGIKLLKVDETLEGYYLFLGNTPAVRHSWFGKIHGFSLHGRELTKTDVFDRYRIRKGNNQEYVLKYNKDTILMYTFEEKHGDLIPDKISQKNPLKVPKNLKFEKKILSPIKIKDVLTLDFTANIIGFIPFGYLSTLCLIIGFRMQPTKVYLITIMTGAVVSASIELSQIFLPLRTSSQMDIICNIAGTFIGTLISIWHLPHLSFKGSPKSFLINERSLN